MKTYYINKAFIFLLMVSWLLLSCSTKSSNSNHDTTIINYTIKQGKPLPAKEWHCYNVDVNEEKICIPSKWNLINQNKFLLMSNLNNADSNSYFVVLKYNKQITGLSPFKYLKETYSQLKKDSLQKFTGYKASRIIYNDKEVFSCEYYTSINNEPYVTYSTVLVRENDLFEIALKVYLSKANTYQEYYKDILFNFYYRNNLVFSDKDEIKGVEIVNLAAASL